MKFQPVVALVMLLFFPLEMHAQTTAFAYQGRLSDNGSAANGNYDFRFRIFDVSSNAVAGPITNLLVNVTNGQFSATLNFGSGVFDGSDRWLEIAVRSNGTVFPFIPLTPLQPITSVPYAIQSLKASISAFATNAQNAANATQLVVPLPGTNINGTIPIANLPTNVAFLNSNQTFIGANGFAGTVIAPNTGNNLAGTFSGTFVGNGASLTNIPATVLTGTLPDARLSSNVALLDNTNNPNLTFAASITATNFIGAGHGLTNVPGAFFWVTVAGASAQSYPNVGYICTNTATPVTITLPASPGAGDTFKILGVGAAGWKVAQNAGQTIISGGLSTSIGQSWKAVGLKTNWAAIACSSDGTKMVAAANGGNIYTSGDSGSTWTLRSSAPRTNWSALASSSDGTKLYATVGYIPNNTGGNGYIYKSTDSGATWTTSFAVRSNWTCIACSADGSQIIAASRTGPIYISSNSGGTWGFLSGSEDLLWTSVASSSDGTKLLAVDANGQIFVYTSITGWTNPTNFPGVQLDSATCSSDGSRMIVVGNSGQIYLSVDSGTKWVQQYSPAVAQLSAVATSADGSRLATAIGTVVSVSSGNIYASSDSAATWIQLTGSPSVSWTGLASSFDGSLLAGTVWNDYIYVSSQSSTTTGTAGYLSGAQHSAIELIYVGNGNFLPLNHEGTIRAF